MGRCRKGTKATKNKSPFINVCKITRHCFGEICCDYQNTSLSTPHTIRISALPRAQTQPISPLMVHVVTEF